mmetsp:Transcript_66974/g.146811  ORF Transcript_66974/g.146811 Transcript_66974/m.146811 type:complete len:237 (-) Transcript_66974:68-778(-)
MPNDAIHHFVDLLLVIDIWERFIWHRDIQEFAQRLPTFLHIKDQELLRRHSGLDPFNPCLEGLDGTLTIRTLHPRQHGGLVKTLGALLALTASLVDPHGPMLLRTTPGPNGVDHAVIPLLGVSDGQQDLGLWIGLHQFLVHATGGVIHRSLVELISIRMGENGLKIRFAVVGFNPLGMIWPFTAFEHVVTGSIQQLLQCQLHAVGAGATPTCTNDLQIGLTLQLFLQEPLRHGWKN